jgi:hypothetical protein
VKEQPACTRVTPVSFVLVIGGLLAGALLSLYRSGLVKKEGKQAASVGVVSGTTMGVASAMLVIVGAGRADATTDEVVLPFWFTGMDIVILAVRGIWSINRR